MKWFWTIFALTTNCVAGDTNPPPTTSLHCKANCLREEAHIGQFVGVQASSEYLGTNYVTEICYSDIKNSQKMEGRQCSAAVA